MDDSGKLSHVDASGKASMVDVSGKPRVKRTARAACSVLMAPATAELIRANAMAKGDVLATARVAGIMAGKKAILADGHLALDPARHCHRILVDDLAAD